MENKYFGLIILGISIVIIFITFLFQNAMKNIVAASCTMAEQGRACPMYTTINQQTYLALAIVGVVIIIGFIFIFTKPEEKIVVKKVKEKKQKREIDLNGFRPIEKEVFKLIQENGTIFQADLIEKTGFTKAKMTRILDKLEGHKLIERKRRGLTNVVVLKEI